MGYEAISEKIVELLETIEGLTVYDHEPRTLGSFPCATVQAAGHRNRFHDTAANARQFSFAIRLFYDDKVPRDAETILRAYADQVIQILEANVTVPGVWDVAQPTEAVWRFAEREIPVRIAEITADFRVRVNR